MLHLTPELVELNALFQLNGYFIAHRLLTQIECAKLKAEALRVVAEYGKPSASAYVGAAAASEMFSKLAEDKRIVSCLAAIMPDGIAFMSDKVVFKSTRQAAATPWHYDVQYWPGTRPKISVWIPLDDATRDNGTLKVVRGSHLREWQTHRGNGINKDGDFALSATPNQWAPEDEIVCELERGSAIFFSDRLLHASTPNATGADRYTIISTYHAPVEVEEPFDSHFSARRVIQSR
jgi:ectoine hydroxylase-related dioxygenase (phytanoyl-CoA dioxygenase family)